MTPARPPQRRPARLPAALPPLALLLASLLPHLAPAQTAWTAGTSNWFTNSNWSLGTPNSLADAVVANAGTPQILAPGAAARSLRVGRSTGAGNLLASGPGTLNVSTDLFINESGVAASSMTVQNGATVNAPATVVGHSGTANSSLTISGASTTFNANTSFALGLSRGATALTVQSGATLNTTAATVGTGFLANSTATVTGPNSRWTNAGTLAITDSATDSGTLNVSNQGTVWTDSLNIGPAGTLNLTGGTLRMINYTRHSAGDINYTSGTVRLDDPQPAIRVLGSDPAITDFFGTTVPAGKSLVLGPITDLRSGIPLAVNGGSISGPYAFFIGSSSTVTNGGTMQFATLILTNPPFSGGAAVTFTGPGSTGTFSSLLLAATADGPDGRVVVQNQALLQFGTVTGGGEIHLAGGTVSITGYEPIEAVPFFTSGTLQLIGDRILGEDLAARAFFGAAPLIAAGKALAVQGTATLATSHTLTLAGGTFTGPSLVLAPGSKLLVSQAGSSVTATILAATGSTIDTTAANLTIGDATKPNGFYSNATLLVGPRTVTLADANDAVLDAASLTTLAAGTLSAPNGLTLNFGANLTGHGTLSTPNDPARPLINNGHITGTSPSQRLTLPGFVKGVGTLSNVLVTGTLSPGFSPATVHYGPVNYAGTLQLDISPLGSDLLIHSGPVSLAGRLELLPAPGPPPAYLTRLTLLTATSLTGQFSSVTGSLLDPLHAYAPIYTPTSLQLVLTLPGDANLDGQLTPDDFALLDRGFARRLTTWPNGDFNSDGTINPQDYLLLDRTFLLLKAQASQPPDPSLLSLRTSQFGPQYVTQLLTSIPEPSLPAILLATLPLLPRHRKLRSKRAPQTRALRH